MGQFYLKPEYKKFLFTKISKIEGRYSVDFIIKPAKNLQEVLSSTNFKRDEWPYTHSELDNLVNEKIIYLNEMEGFYILTYKGLAILEYNLKFSNELDNFLNDLNLLLFDKNFKMIYKSLKSKDKAILLTVLGLHAFSPDLSIYVDKSNKSDFVKSVDYAIELLKKHQPENANELDTMWDSKVVGDDPILQFLRSKLDEIPKKTDNIFKVASKNKHGIYVDIIKEDGSINEERTLFLLRRIFDNKIFNMDQKQEMINTLNNIEKGFFTLIRSTSTKNRVKIKIQLRDIVFEKL